MSCRFDALANKLPPMLPPGRSALVDAEDVATACFALRKSPSRAEIGEADAFHLACNFSAFCDSNQ